MKLSESAAITATISPTKLGAVEDWVKTIVKAYEDKDPKYTDLCYAEEGSLEMSGFPPVKGIAALKEFYAWQFVGAEKVDFVLQSAHLIPGQIIFNLTGSATFTNKIVTPLDWMVVIGLAEEEMRIKSAKVYRGGDAYLENITANVGPFPGFH